MTATVTEQLIDEAARQIIETKTESTLFVEAGAGSGKTHALVARICRLALVDGIELDRVAAITFTEKAAAELRERVRGRLADGVSDTGVPDTAETAERRRVALGQIDTAAIGTLHSFAARIVGEHPLEAGVPPRISVVDAMGSALAFDGRWQQMRGTLFPRETGADAAAGAVDAAMTVLLDAGASLDQLREVAMELDKHWDRLPESEPAAVLSRPDPQPLLTRADLLLDNLDSCVDHTDKFAGTLARVRQWRADLAAAGDREWMAVARRCPTRGNGGAAKNWVGGKEQVTELKDEVTAIGAAAIELCDVYVQRALAVVIGEISAIVLEQAHARRRSGALEFHDLLVLARQVLNNKAVQAQLHHRYQRILLDEFQDTDPLQLEIAEAITAGVPGRLFTVGDPKQSIYRFRRADIATYMAARESPSAGEIVTLQTNFRSARPVLAWANAVFSTLITAEHHVQPEYGALEPAPGRPEWSPEWGPEPFVFATPREEEDESLSGLAPAEVLRVLEARDVASVIATAVTRGWRKEVGGHGKFDHVPLSLQDVCLLIPSRTCLPYLEAALDAAHIEYRAEASSLVYSTQEIHDLLLAVRALAVTADSAALVGTLRSALFGIGDDDLLRWKSAGGRWHIGAEAPESMAGTALASAMTYLQGLSHELPELSPAALLGRLAEERGVFEVALDTPRFRDAWRRLRFVIDQAQAWYDADGGDLRDYLAWAQTQQAEDARVTEAVLPEVGVQAVRIMTMHSAKGLQFPMVVVAGMSGGFRQTPPPVLWDHDGGLQVYLSANARTGGYSGAKQIEDAHTAAERIRLLYVACTRAESFLAVSGHRAEKGASWGRILAEGLEGVPNETPKLVQRLASSGGGPAVQDEAPLWEQWKRDGERAAAMSRRPSTLSATSIGHAAADGDTGQTAQAGEAVRAAYASAGLVPAAAAEERVPAAVGARESGADFGTALHAFLESAELSAPFDEAGARAAAAAAEIEAADRFAALAQSAWESAPVRAAAVREHWREMALAGHAPDGDLVIEGIADLVYRADDGTLVIVDYKTDVGVSAGTLEAYWTQLSVYADLLSRVAGETVSALVLIFLREGRSTVLERRF